MGLMTFRAPGFDTARLDAFWASGFRRFRHVNIIISQRVARMYVHTHICRLGFRRPGTKA